MTRSSSTTGMSDVPEGEDAKENYQERKEEEESRRIAL
jgi:hypothetical protein